jgi:hypothetical protein
MAERYKSGDVLLQFLNQKVLETPELMREWRASKRDDARQMTENRRLDLIAEGQEKDREFRNSQAKINQQNLIRQQEYKKELDADREKNNLLRLATEPYQKAMIYRRYGDH